MESIALIPTSFSDLTLLPAIQQALGELDYQTPTPIQAQAIPPLLEGRDLLGCAQTGTGKTAAFALPILHRLAGDNRRSTPHSPRVLILAPTRELASQIGESFLDYGRFLKLRTTVVFGGVPMGRQIKAMQRGVHILVATPGRLLDLAGQGYINFDQVETFVLDEADRMLDMGFLPDLRRIISKLPQERHSLFFSATLPKHAAELAADLLTDPVRIDIAPESPTVERIEQQVLYVPGSQKVGVLGNILANPEVGKILVFTRTKRGADRLAKILNQNDVPADAIHGNKSQNARTRTLENFRRNKLQVLVATDLAARGIDVDGVTHVVNYDLPVEPESYVHRIGRTGRAGASGVALTLCDPSERRQFRDIEKLIKMSIPVHPDYPDKMAGFGGEQRGGKRASGNRQRPQGGQRREGGQHREGGQRRDGGPRHGRPAHGGQGARRHDDSRKPAAEGAAGHARPRNKKRRPGPRKAVATT